MSPRRRSRRLKALDPKKPDLQGMDLDELTKQANDVLKELSSVVNELSTTLRGSTL